MTTVKQATLALTSICRTRQERKVREAWCGVRELEGTKEGPPCAPVWGSSRFALYSHANFPLQRGSEHCASRRAKP